MAPNPPTLVARFSGTITANRSPAAWRPNPGEETARMTPPITVYTNVG